MCSTYRKAIYKSLRNCVCVCVWTVEQRNDDLHFNRNINHLNIQ